MNMVHTGAIVYVVATTPTGGPNTPDIAIDSTHVLFALDVDKPFHNCTTKKQYFSA